MQKYNNEEIFISQCPCLDCPNTDLIYWHHFGCPNFSKLYISDLAMVRCGFCGMNSEFLNCKFDCGKHCTEANSIRFRIVTKLKKILSFIGALEDDKIINQDFLDKLSYSLILQFRKSQQK